MNHALVNVKQLHHLSWKVPKHVVGGEGKGIEGKSVGLSVSAITYVKH